MERILYVPGNLLLEPLGVLFTSQKYR